jgi:PAS domain-containing protein
MTEPQQDDNLFRLIFNAVPLPLFRVNRDVEIFDLNRAAQVIFNATPAQALKKRVVK